MNIKGKTKDTLNSKYDIVELAIQKKLHPYIDDKGQLCIPHPSYV